MIELVSFLLKGPRGCFVIKILHLSKITFVHIFINLMTSVKHTT